MMNPLKIKGRILFVRNRCPYCFRWEKFIYYLNSKLKRNKRIKVINCSKYFKYGIYDNPLIKIFENDFDAFPTLFFDGEKKEGANSLIECKAWIITRLILNNDFIFEETPEYLPSINKYMIFDKECKYIKRKVFCK